MATPVRADGGGAWRAPPAVRLSIGLHAAALGALAWQPAWWPGVAAALLANHAVLGAAGMTPRSQWLGATLHRLPARAGAQAVALTFDDGPDPAVTPAVLDLLAGAGVRASFFCIGERARAHPALVRRIAEAGHRVENHTLTHPGGFACLPPRWLRREVAGAQGLLADLAGRAPVWFRSPMGFRSPLVLPVLAKAGLQQAAWSRRGYDTRSRDPARVLERLTMRLAANDVLLLHDGNVARNMAGPVVLQVLPGLLAALGERGLTAVALPDGAPAGADAAETQA